ncbi:GNAT family N-acetyltransferase [Nocardioides bruguierae]|uniref:GNAT family N-acetyltransferase n=1 Tax=Nocardioides bruguierae TaxID=2945102 RepID=UPI0020205516|nr:GNAT family N-acetyltransferase [Nocardioides bruguierae]MCL8025150.1 GNAT family N-acetyltransferase [Nocardioides bruguierae]
MRSPHGAGDAAGGVPADVLAHLDLVARDDADVHEVGPFTQFVGRGAWGYYARPRLGTTHPFTADDVRALAAAQTRLGSSHDLEWVAEEAPTLEAAAREAGLHVDRHPLLVLPPGVEPVAPATDLEVRLLGADDADLPAVHACISLGFATPGTAVGEAGAVERDQRAAGPQHSLDQVRGMLRAGTRVQAGAFDVGGVGGVGAVGGGAHHPVQRDGVSATEIVGVATLPASRRRGAAGALTALLARHARAAGVRTVFCSASDEAVARVYEAVGFVRVGTALATTTCEDRAP